MDKTYIKSQHIVERYLSGDLTVREARDFEKFCLENPDVLNTLPIPVRVKQRMSRKVGLDVEEAGFDPTATDTSIMAAELEEDDEEPRVTGFKGLPQEARRWAIILGAISLISLASVAVLWIRASNLEKQLLTTQRAAKAAQLRAPGSVEEYRVRPGTSKNNPAAVTVGTPNPPQLIDLHIDMSESRYNTFLITLENVELGRVMQVQRVARDSNRALRLNINSSALGPGNYDLQIEGYTWRGDTYPVGWVRLGMK
jgi:hypothetical protein